MTPAPWCGKGIKALALWWTMSSSALLPPCPKCSMLAHVCSTKGKAAWSVSCGRLRNQKREDLMAQGHLTQALFGCGTQRLDS